MPSAQIRQFGFDGGGAYPGSAGEAHNFLAVFFTPAKSALKSGMVLVPADGENIEINGGQGFVDVVIDDDFVDNTKRFDKVDTLLGGVKDIRMGFCLQNDRAILNGHNQVITQPFCVFKKAQVAEMEVVKHPEGNHFFMGF